MSTLPILTYHGIESDRDTYFWEKNETLYVLETRSFETQMQHLVQMGFETLSLDQIGPCLGGILQSRAVVITFDDGHISHYEHVLPRFAKFHSKAIFFIPAAFIGKRGYMSWAHLREILKSGHTIGSHGLNHVPLTNLSDTELTGELEFSKKMLEDGLGIEITSLSIPRGFYRRKISSKAYDLGYRFVFTSQFDVNPLGTKLLNLRRMVVRVDTSLSEFANMLAGNLGSKRPVERMKHSARQLIHPKVYDFLAGVKRVGLGRMNG